MTALSLLAGRTVACTGWCKTLSFSMWLLRDTKKPNVFHHPVQAKYLNFHSYIYILYYQSIILNYLPSKPTCYSYKKNYSTVTEMLKQQESKSHEHNVMAMCDQ